MKQVAYNEANGITPRSITKSRDEILASTFAADRARDPDAPGGRRGSGPRAQDIDVSRVFLADLDRLTPAEVVERLREEMYRAAKELDFETAASLRDRIDELVLDGELAGPPSIAEERGRASNRHPRARYPKPKGKRR